MSSPRTPKVNLASTEEKKQVLLRKGASQATGNDMKIPARAARRFKE